MGRKSKKGTIHIIGGGPAGMMAAEVLCDDWEVAVYEKGKTIGRKFLVAGKGGFNLTNSATGNDLTDKYWPPGFLDAPLNAFDSVALRQWLLELGIPTFVGTSGRVFPERGIKPIEVLQKWKDRLTAKGVQWHLKNTFLGFSEKMEVQVKDEHAIHFLKADYTIFALGGASWSVTGSTGDWTDAFQKIGVPTLPFQASNCGVDIHWPPGIWEFHSGKPLKNIALSVGGATQIGEALITEYGLEGNAVYPLTRVLRELWNQDQNPLLYLDLKPTNTETQLLEKIQGKASRNLAAALRLSPAAMALLKTYTDKATYTDPSRLCAAIKRLPLPVDGLRPVEEAISTVGGIDRGAVATDFSLKKYPQFFVIGEMLDWDAPTGGYLLQGCLAMGRSLGGAINKKK